MTERLGTGIIRHGFRTREDGTLPIRDCPACGQKTYTVPAGGWRHWGTLAEACGPVPVVVVSVAVCKPRHGAKSTGTDTPERIAARAGLREMWRRPSWEWMGCRETGETAWSPGQ